MFMCSMYSIYCYLYCSRPTAFTPRRLLYVNNVWLSVCLSVCLCLCVSVCRQ